MKKGILFEISTTNFNEAVKMCEIAFDDCDSVEWFEVKESKDFKKLSDFLTAMDVDNELFELKD